MAIFKFEKGTHIDHFFDKVGPMWHDLWDSETDLLNCDFEIMILVTKKQEKKKGEYTSPPNLARKV